jgi:hypothetical protein
MQKYQPIIAIFGVTFLMALAACIYIFEEIYLVNTLEFFIAFSMCVLAILKLRDLKSFTTEFLGYDLLARKYVPYAYIYPFAEAAAGIGMLSGLLMPVFGVISVFIGSIGAASVVEAVYVQKKDLKCACVDGNSKVPLGAISLTENLMMVVMGLWMIIKVFLF